VSVGFVPLDITDCSLPETAAVSVGFVPLITVGAIFRVGI
jgi:hypothetical protein